MRTRNGSLRAALSNQQRWSCTIAHGSANDKMKRRLVSTGRWPRYRACMRSLLQLHTGNTVCSKPSCRRLESIEGALFTAPFAEKDRRSARSPNVLVTTVDPSHPSCIGQGLSVITRLFPGGKLILKNFRLRLPNATRSEIDKLAKHRSVTQLSSLRSKFAVSWPARVLFCYKLD